MSLHFLLTRLRWQLDRNLALVTAGMRSVRQRGWRATLAHIPRRLGWGLRTDLAMLPCGQRHVVIIDAQIPDPTRDSGSVRLLEVFALLQARGLGIAFAPHSGTADATERRRLAELGIALIGVNGSSDLPDWLRQRRQDICGVMLCRHPVASTHLPLIRQLLPAVPVAFDTVDLHYLRLERAAALGNDPSLQVQARNARHSELALVDACNVTYVVSEVEAAVLSAARPHASIAVLSNIHHLQPPGPGPAQRCDALFVGGWGHHPNQDAIAWLTGEIWSLVRQSRPQARLHLVGDIPADQARQLRLIPGVVVHGRIDTLEPLMAQCRVSVAPLRVGAGVKGKVNSAMSHGLPVVLTTIAAEGMFIEDGQNALVADTPGAFAAAICRLLGDDALWQSLSEGGRQNVRDHFSPAAADRALAHWLAANTPQEPAH